MKGLISGLLLVVAAATVFAQAPAPAVKGSVYGKTVSAKGALPVSQLSAQLGKAETASAKVTGKVVDVCQKKGCFLKLEVDGGETMMVRFKDYGFFVPTDINGKTVVLDGIAKQETLSVDDLKHYAEDAKKSEAEIAKITSPKKELTFEATGVLVL